MKNTILTAVTLLTMSGAIHASSIANGGVNAPTDAQIALELRKDKIIESQNKVIQTQNKTLLNVNQKIEYFSQAVGDLITFTKIIKESNSSLKLKVVSLTRQLNSNGKTPITNVADKSLNLNYKKIIDLNTNLKKQVFLLKEQLAKKAVVEDSFTITSDVVYNNKKTSSINKTILQHKNNLDFLESIRADYPLQVKSGNLKLSIDKEKEKLAQAIKLLRSIK